MFKACKNAVTHYIDELANTKSAYLDLLRTFNPNYNEFENSLDNMLNQSYADMNFASSIDQTQGIYE